MSASHIYYVDTENATGRRFRTTVLPAGSSVLTPTLEPAWGDDPAPGSNFIRIPAGAITLGAASPTGAPELPTSTDAKFTGNLPLGLAETTTYSIAVNFAHLQSSADLIYLASCLIRDRVSVPNAINDNVPADSYGFGPRAITVSPVVTIRHDGRNAALAVADFPVRFQGIIRTQPGRKGTVTPGVGVVIEYELYHIARAVLESVTMADVCGQTFHTSYGSGATASPRSGSDGGGFVRVYDMTWKSGSNVYSWFHEPKDQRVRLYHRAHLMKAAQRCATAAYCAFTRQTPSYATWQFRFRGQGEDATDYHATPWDHWTYHKQDHTSAAATVTNERGAALSARTDVHFLGTIALESDPTVYYGGLLMPYDSAASLHAFGTLWDFLAEACNDALCKAIVRQTTATACALHFLRLDDTTTGSTTSATLADLRGAAAATGAPDAITFSIGEAAVCGVKIAPRQAFEGEVPDYVTTDATDGDQPKSTQAIWDTRPSLGRDAYLYYGDNGDYDCEIYRRSRAWPMWKLYYVDTLSIFGGTLENAYRVHDAVAIHDGTADIDAGSVAPITLPTPSATLTSWTDESAFTKPLAEQISIRQRAGGSFAAIAAMIAYRFGINVDPVLWTMTVTADLCTPDDLGERYSFGLTASAFIGTGETTLDGLSADGILVAVKLDDSSDRADITLLAGGPTP